MACAGIRVQGPVNMGRIGTKTSETRDPLPLRLSRRHRLPITLANAAFATAFTTTFHRESRCLAPILPMSSQPSRQW
jgi:hypothetical protein